MPRLFALALVAAVAAGCSAEEWPAPPAVDEAQYQKDHQAWRDDERQGLASVLSIAGIWPIPEGETAFGSDPSLPIALPAAHFPVRAGVFRRTGDTVTVIPDAGAALRLDDGSRIADAREMESLISGDIRLDLASAGDDRRWLMAIDTKHPAIANPPDIEAYAPDPAFRVSARFEAFDQPRPVRVPDVRGGTMDFTALGQLVFRLGGEEERRLTAFGEPGSDVFFVMFRDPTNQSTTYSGYRIVTPPVADDGEWTVLDFNFATNPPCAYSRYTTCPLPPPENRLDVAVEAGLKRLPSAQGYSPAS